MLVYLFQQYDAQARSDGYSKMPPYAFLMRAFLEEPVMRMNHGSLANIVRFLPLMRCKWRLKYYAEQYSHVRRVFDAENKPNVTVNDAGASRPPWILRDQRWGGVPTS